MLAKRIIPCLDVDNGRVVKGIRFVSLTDAGDPVAQAKRYDLEGADELTFLDITASSDRREIVAELVRRVADEVFIPFTVGGGLRSVEDIRAILRAGADKITLNTAAVEDPKLISACAETFGSQCVVVAIDARGRDDRRLGSLHAWRPAARRTRCYRMGHDGGKTRRRRDSSDEHGLRRHARRLRYRADARSFEAVRIPVIASGGAGKVEHFYDALTAGGASAVLAASLFHFGELSIGDVKTYLRGRGLEVR